MLELKNIHKVYNAGTVNEQVLFENFSLSVPEGEFISVVGSNGSGKTSLLNLICGSIRADGGQILINGTDISKQKDYVRHRRKFYGLSRGTNKGRVEYYKDMLRGLNLGLEDKFHVPVGSLSGGQRQALALIMATLQPIEFLILDEHTAALDPKTAEIIMELTDQIVREKKVTTIMVTHNLRYAVEYGNRLLMMHQGSVILDKDSEEKNAISVDDILGVFNEISIECGN